MTSATDDSRAQLRRTAYLLLICIGTGAMLGRIFAVDSVDKIGMQEYRLKQIGDELARRRAELEERGVQGKKLQRELTRIEKALYDRALLRRPFLSANDRSRWCTLRALVEKDMRVEGAPYSIDNVIQQPTWDTIDMVKHDGHLYSSKPPLLPTLMAGQYWLINRTTGMTLGTHPYTVGRLILVTFNVIPLLVYFVLLARLIERFGTTDFGRLFAMSAAVFGTFLVTFAIVINNHLPAAVCAAVAIYALVRIWFDDERRLRYFVIAGTFAALTAANELPAAALAAAIGLALLWKAPKQTLIASLPAALLVGVAFFGTSWIAHRSLKPAYMHRSEGDNWYDYTFERNGHQHESYWNNPVGVDQGEQKAAVYALHVLVGHHGIFSLTPVWILSVAGAVLWLLPGQDRRLRELALLIVAVSLVCLAFYLSRGPVYRNYGGVTSGLRWMFWFAPLWLLLLLPAADAMASRRWTRGVALALLIVSVLSACYPTWNPWVHPWLMDYLHYLGWV